MKAVRLFRCWPPCAAAQRPDAEQLMASRQSVQKVTKVVKVKGHTNGRTFTSKYRGVHQTFPTKRWEAQFRCPPPPPPPRAPVARGHAQMHASAYMHTPLDRGSCRLRQDTGRSSLQLFQRSSIGTWCRQSQLEMCSPRPPSASPLGAPLAVPAHTKTMGCFDGTIYFARRRNGKPTSLGCFDQEVEASRAYDKMILWVDLHSANPGGKAGITNFEKSEYGTEMSYLLNVSQV